MACSHSLGQGTGSLDSGFPRGKQDVKTSALWHTSETGHMIGWAPIRHSSGPLQTRHGHRSPHVQACSRSVWAAQVRRPSSPM
ncbi:hypothetical protein NDU88_002617 [Pleurodeles waltl]|uniref:Uncharacterized protein n=1 Tax=Pleurodeles waltl TaxID=8319 RepID=A0AAV7WQ19_PLEWA|nr:hypothetical protein NDU88_002617 [Pleurodeles waltl]